MRIAVDGFVGEVRGWSTYLEWALIRTRCNFELARAHARSTLTCAAPLDLRSTCARLPLVGPQGQRSLLLRLEVSVDREDSRIVTILVTASLEGFPTFSTLPMKTRLLRVCCIFGSVPMFIP